MSSSPSSGSVLAVWSLLGILSLCLSAPPLPALSLSLSLKINLKEKNGSDVIEIVVNIFEWLNTGNVIHECNKIDHRIKISK